MATVHPIETNYGTITTWIPLTTQLPSAAACFSAIYSIKYAAGEGGLFAFDPFSATIDSTSTVECVPPEATEWWSQPYSPTYLVSSLGPLTCPQAYTTAFAISTNIGSTRIGCCPSGYAFQGNSLDYGTFGQCASSLTPGQKYTFLTLSESLSSWLPGSTSAGPSGLSVIGIQINGWDFGGAATSSTSFPASSTASSPAGSSSTAASVSHGSGGLSAGASAGIAVGITVVVFAALGLLAFIVFTRRRRRREVQEGTSEPLPELNSDSQRYSAWSQGKTMSEMPTEAEPVELSTPKGPYELT